MLVPLSRFAVSAATVFALSACATAPSPLMAGIPSTSFAKSGDNLRLATDPVCQRLYENAANYVPQAKRPGVGQNILTSVGLSVLTSVVASAVAPGAGTLGGVAARSATASATAIAGSTVVNEINKPVPLTKELTQAASRVGCPLTPAAPNTGTTAL